MRPEARSAKAHSVKGPFGDAYLIGTAQAVEAGSKPGGSSHFERVSWQKRRHARVNAEATEMWESAASQSAPEAKMTKLPRAAASAAGTKLRQNGGPGKR